MKKTIFTLALLTISLIGHAQWDNNGNNSANGSLELGQFTINNGSYIEPDDDIYKIIDHTYNNYNNYILGWAWSNSYGDNTRIGWGGSGAGNELIISEKKGLIWNGKAQIGGFTINNGEYTESDDVIYKVIDHTSYDNYILGWAWSNSYGDNTRIGWGGSGAGNELIISEKKGLIWNGNVGIGTSNPDEKLTVKGTIHCEEVLVDLQVPADYVFEKYYEGASTLKATYTMPTLEEVEAFTKKNHHLPAMPSAAQIQEEGLQLKEMTNLLLQKIEELTLYTIEQEKRIKSLEAKLSK